MFDLVVRGGTLVSPEGLVDADLAVEDGLIAAIGRELEGRDVIDASALAVFAGLIDIHVHFNEPGREHWEGAATGSRALAAGGGTLFFDMPLNSTPCTLNAAEFDRKCKALSDASITDFGIWGGLVPGNVERMAELADRGVIGFKAFLCDSGLPEFPRADDLTLYQGLAEAQRLGLPVAVHAESQELTYGLAQRALTNDRRAIRDYLHSRPVIAELEAIQRATLLAEETGAKLHLVHVSSGRGAALAAEARARGVDVSIETCPHYLFFTEEDLERLGTIAKCAPPLRDTGQRSALWEEVRQGHVDIVASDHSPAPADMKEGDFFSAWGGIAGVQSTLAVMLDSGYHQRSLPLERISSLVAAEPARRFRIPRKGRLAEGNDADFVLVNLPAQFTLASEDLMQRHRTSPYVGSCFRGEIRRTVRRGETIYLHGKITAQSQGKLVRPG